MATKSLPETTRKAIFAAIVETEDAGSNPQEARKTVAERFHVTTEQVKAIADEGSEKTWPPLVEYDD